MRYGIRQTGEKVWEFVVDGEVRATRPTKATVMNALVASARDEGLTAAGALQETWSSPAGVAFSEPTGDGRDFTGVVWSWRDPATVPVPLMLQTSTEWGHDGAELAGFVSSFEDRAGTLFATGGLHDSETGIQFRDLLVAGPFGVSLDCGAAEVTEECLVMGEDEWGTYCAESVAHFLTYETIGITGTPFPAFKNATIALDTAQVPAAPIPAPPAVPVPAPMAASVPVAPPRAWFFEPEPQEGDPRLVRQRDGSYACPLTVTADGQVYGHLARWGQCHVGFADACVTPPDSPDGYKHFHVGAVLCDDGSEVATGPLTVGADHARLRGVLAPDARDHYANTGLQWANIRVKDGEFGPWLAGAVRPGLTDEVLAVARASAPSGDWRPIDGHRELIGILSVPVPGFPVARATALAAAAGLEHFAPVRTQVDVVDGEVVALVAANIVSATPCRTCGEPDITGTSADWQRVADAIAAGFASVDRRLSVLDVRTRHLRSTARDTVLDRIHSR